MSVPPRGSRKPRSHRSRTAAQRSRGRGPAASPVGRRSGRRRAARTLGRLCAEDVTRAARIIDLDEFENLFRTFKHTAWRLETRRRYASDEITDTYRQFAETGSVDWDLEDPYCAMIRAQTEQGKRVERVRIADDPPTPGQLYLLDNAKQNTVIGEDIEVCGGPTRHGSACRKRTSGSLTRESWHG